MMKLYRLEDLTPDQILNRDLRAEQDVEEVVDAIIADVRARGDAALRDYALRFDGARLEELEVSAQEMDQALADADPYFLDTLRMAAANIEAFHRRQLRDSFVMTEQDGVILGQKYTPVERAGVYVPGGTAAYPSTVLMDVIPARVAGVPEIVMVTPAGRDGRVAPAILAAAAVAGVTRIFKAGGAQAVAALAYGTESVPVVDKIVAADLLSQAEHDRLASPVLVTDSEALALAVQAEVEAQLDALPRRDIARASVETGGKIILCGSLDQAVDVCNIIAPEHLELCVEDPFALLGRIKNAGSIFLGRNVPEALGDYFAGPNHTLPTSGTARFSSPLGVDDFVKRSSFIYYTREALGRVKDRIAGFAEAEGLHAHARSVTIRYEEGGGGK